MSLPAHLRSLNAAQREAALFGLPAAGPAPPTPPLLIIAGAGTGKTKTLAHRVAQLVLLGAAPARILLLTFSRRAAAELVRRVERICAEALGHDLPLGRSFPLAGTFHAVGAQILRRHAVSIGLDPGFTILDRGDAADLLDLVRAEQNLARTDRRFPRKGTCLAIYSYAVNASLPLAEVLRRQFPWCGEWEAELKRLFGAYVAAKQRQSVLDYDDLLLYWARMMAEPSLAAAVGAEADHVLVDEYQDTNALQGAILTALKPDGCGITVVGDDAQAIYGFRAATVRNILDFPARYAPPAAILRLEENYRSTQPILDAANALMAAAGEGHKKRLTSGRPSGQRPRLVAVLDEAAQVQHVVEHVLAAREAGTALREQAVLFRAAHHSAALEVELVRRNIPFVKYGGLKFLEAAHVKDMLALLRWGENPRDRMAAFRVLQLLPGIGPGIARRALERLEAAGYGLDGLAGFSPPPAAATLWPGLVDLLRRLALPPSWPSDMGLARRFYEPLLLEAYDHPQLRLADLEQLERLAVAQRSRRQFLADLTLDPPEGVGAEAGVPVKDEDYLILSTIHSAKGQEWRQVFLLNLVDGCIPSDLATGTAGEIEEERRLLYVAMTRARDELHLIQPIRFHVTGQRRFGDRYLHAPRSRFITDAMLPLFDRGPGPASTPEAQAAAAPVARVDLAAAMRGMWD